MATAQLDAIETPVPPSVWWIVLLEGIAAVMIGLLLVRNPLWAAVMVPTTKLESKEKFA